MEISVSIEMPFGHRLMNYEGNCKNLHGHNYLITATVEGNPDQRSGFVADFGDVKRRVRTVLEQFDHAMVLNERDPVAGYVAQNGFKYVTLNCEPTAENLSLLFHNLFRDAGIRPSKVAVRETSNSEAVALTVSRDVRITGRSREDN